MNTPWSRCAALRLAPALGMLVTGGAIMAATTAPGAAAAASSPVQVSGKPMYTTEGGASPLPTDRTVPHWYGSFTDPTNGVTYGYNMVGNGDPRTDPGTTTVPTEIIPLNFTFSDGSAYNGSDVTAATVASPVWQDNSYSTVKVTPDQKKTSKLSDAGTTQLEDATMRSQFDQVGSANYHLLLGQPTVLPAQTISVPANQGVVASFGSGFRPFGDISITWFASEMNSLINSLHIDPATLPVFLTDNVYLYEGSPGNCCVLGFHGAAHVTGNGSGSVNGQGTQGVQTYAYAAYAQPGTWSTSSTPATPDGSDGYYIQDIHALSHEVSEWADDPFTDNAVDPWLTPTAPQYGCTSLLETGDPVVGIGVLLGHNPYFQGAGANADGAWHPEDEAFLPWFARQNPNTTSEPVQNGRTGRYTFFGSINPYPGFQQPATGC